MKHLDNDHDELKHVEDTAETITGLCLNKSIFVVFNSCYLIKNYMVTWNAVRGVTELCKVRAVRGII
jgi:hypothetical protein